jgi:hypothetical protein
LGKRCCSYTNGEEQWSVVTPDVQRLQPSLIHPGPVVTTTEEGLRESGMCKSLSRCWACAESLPRKVTWSDVVVLQRSEVVDEGGR